MTMNKKGKNKTLDF